MKSAAEHIISALIPTEKRCLASMVSTNRQHNHSHCLVFGVTIAIQSRCSNSTRPNSRHHSAVYKPHRQRRPKPWSEKRHLLPPDPNAPTQPPPPPTRPFRAVSEPRHIDLWSEEAALLRPHICDHGYMRAEKLESLERINSYATQTEGFTRVTNVNDGW